VKGGTTPLCAVEDWSGAGFHIKQALNVGQPTVSQVVSSLDNQSCLPEQGAQEWQTGKQEQHSAVMCGRGGSERWRHPRPSPSKLRGSGTPEELSFPPDARLMWAIDCKSSWWSMPSAQQGSASYVLVVSCVTPRTNTTQSRVAFDEEVWEPPWSSLAPMKGLLGGGAPDPWSSY